LREALGLFYPFSVAVIASITAHSQLLGSYYTNG
jgi:hypothetical protein